jgi:hypothetical protein
MVELNDREARELRERLQGAEAARAAEETIVVLTNARTSVSFTPRQKAAVLDVLTNWVQESGREGIGDGPSTLRDALAADVGRQ